MTAAPWNGPFDPFTDADAVVIRATWDYHEAPDAYLTWLGRLDPARTFNPPDLVRWNLAKTYIADLAARGAALPRAMDVPATASDVAEALEVLDLDDAVIKPVIGASGFGVERVRPGEEAAALERVRSRKATDRVLVQGFVAGIEAGELAGVFFDGAFSHALRRVPASGDFRVNSQYGGRMELAEPSADTIGAMASVLALVPGRPLYARVDGVAQSDRFVVMEVEVNEPALGLDLVPGAADRFADALLARLSSG